MRRWTLALLLACALAACESDGDGAGGEGTVTVSAYGESFIEEGIPATAMSDGWEVTFERFVVTITDVAVAGQALAAPAPVDLTAASDGAGQALGTVTAAAGEHTGAEFRVQRLEVRGAATKDGVTKTFDWDLDVAAGFSNCDTTTAVAAAGSATFQITIHADHLFYDSLVAEDPALGFQAYADADAAGDGDGAITRAELEAADIGAFDPGNEDVDDLWSWLLAAARTVGHVDGEGHCEAAPL